MDTMQAEKVSALAKSLYSNRLAASMEEAADMARVILGGSRLGEEQSLKALAEEVPDVEALAMKKKEENPAVPQKSSLEVRESTVSSPSEEPPRQSHQQKMENLRRILSEEQERIAALQQELEALKAERAASFESASGIVGEIEELAGDIDHSKEGLDQLRQHVKDLEELKQEFREVEQSQQRLDDAEQKAQAAKEALEQSLPDAPVKPSVPLDEWEDAKSEED